MPQLLLLLLLVLAGGTAWSAEDALINRAPGGATFAPGPSGPFVPGSVIILPDGRRTVIDEILPNGQWQTSLGVITPTPEVVLAPPEAVRPETQLEQPGTAQAIAPEVPAAESPAGKAVAPAAQGEKPVAPAAEPQYYTLAQLLPMTQVPEASPKTEERPRKPEKQERAEKPHEAKPEKKPAPEKKVAPKEEKKPAQERKVEKAKTGQPLRIPEQAAKTGNLEFLEGCWQGTRPEYYSKRTIKECFCFGSGGKTGKRRVLDYTQGRSCIGSTRATLSSQGVLRVISGGAACTDGQRWGQAEMVCKNSGPRTPCSWVFRDAQNGHQSYEIPFVRVESCGR